ncbi:MAG: hypothetical protein HKN68_00730, partial [Saprospiraceae bacterium]|nr:hypothetical protein [Saprospiraceae bacterium]
MTTFLDQKKAINRIFLTLFVTVFALSLLSSNSVKGQQSINDYVIRAEQDVNLGSSNTITGIIGAGSSVSAESSTFIDGDIYVDGTVSLSGATVTGTVYQTPLPITLPILPPLSQSEAGGIDITSTQTINPGSHGSIQISSNNNTITFNGPGVYKFQSIEITANNTDFIFDFNSQPGDIIIYVHGDMNVGKSSASLKANGGGAANRILTEIRGNGSSNGYAFSMDNGNGGKGSKWLGTVLAPYGSIKFGSGTGSSNITGALL